MEQFDAKEEKKRGNEYAFSLAWVGGVQALARALMPLLTTAAQNENPVYRGSRAMRDVANALHKTPMFERQTKALARFLQYEGSIHIEGYARFRMSEYSESLDLLSYRLIKKLNLFACKDWS